MFTYFIVHFHKIVCWICKSMDSTNSRTSYFSLFSSFFFFTFYSNRAFDFVCELNRPDLNMYCISIGWKNACCRISIYDAYFIVL